MKINILAQRFKDFYTPKDIYFNKAGIISSSIHLLLIIFILVKTPPIKINLDHEKHVAIEVLKVKNVTNLKNKKITPKEDSIKKTSKLDKHQTKPKAKDEKIVKKESPKQIEEKKNISKNAPKIVREKPKLKPILKAKVKPIEKPKKIAKRLLKKKTDFQDFESLLKNLEDSKESNFIDGAEKDPKNYSKTKKFNENETLSLSVQDSIKQQFRDCWSPPSGALNIKDIIITVKVLLDSDGTVRNVKERSGTILNSSFAYKAALGAALRAVWKCSPVKNLPKDQYHIWKEMEFSFDPSEMIY